MTAAGDRIAALDLVRGVAVLGIVAVNICSFAAAPSALYSPNLPVPGSSADEAAWLAMFVLFEGKMRALFSILFGASLLLFVERAGADQHDGERWQMRRLGWLALIGYLHYLLLWDGDILFLYAVAGLIALRLRHAPPLALTASALFLFTLWQAWGWSMWHAPMQAEAAVMAGAASSAQAAGHAELVARYRSTDAEELMRVSGEGMTLIAYKLLDDPLRPARIVFYALGETLSLVLIGMALHATGFFTGHWRRWWLALLAIGGVGLGGFATVTVAAKIAAANYPEVASRFAINYGLGFAHLAMALGYAALLMLAAEWLMQLRPGRWLIAAGRMALSNYVGTSLVLCGLFYGWGLGLAGSIDRASQSLIVVTVWCLMLAGSVVWLHRHRQGPLEALWRRLTRLSHA